MPPIPPNGTTRACTTGCCEKGANAPSFDSADLFDCKLNLFDGTLFLVSLSENLDEVLFETMNGSSSEFLGGFPQEEGTAPGIHGTEGKHDHKPNRGVPVIEVVESCDEHDKQNDKRIEDEFPHNI